MVDIRLLICCTTFLISQVYTSALPNFLFGRPTKFGFNGFGDRVNSINRHGLENFLDIETLEKSDSNPYPDVQTGWFTNKVDHFDPTNNDTYQQYYQYNTKYFQKSNVYDVVFMMVGGEDPVSAKWVQKPDYQYMQMAQTHGAYIYQLEHRFFGQSIPYGNMNMTNVKYFTTEQALEDLAAFIRSMSKQFTNPRWVIFGGSYPGAMTAWFAAKYPDLYVGAVASSAPVELKLDFYEYPMVMQNTIKREGQACYDAVNASFIALQKATLTAQGRAHLNQIFNLQPAFNESTLTQLDITNFLANVFSTFQGIVQYTYDGRDETTKTIYTTKTMCQYMTGVKGPLGFENIAAVLRWTNKVYGMPENSPLQNSYWDSLTELKQTTYTYGTNDNSDAMAARGWMWLCCNEMGWLQTTDQGRNIFQQLIPLNFYVNMCTDIFDSSVNINFVRDNNKKAKKYFGGADSYSAANVILPNGNLDPWHALGTYVTNNATHQYPYLIDGTAHCGDMYPDYDGQPASLGPVRQFIKSTVSDFIKAGNTKW
uniref:Serine protease K12H4.7 n=1 Tax=Parastrongyloides trichosuri TaxID=131310 RepID=A0A0N4ZGJ9_PARTI